ncbi:phosphatase PAP2 family protein [Pseudonocardia nematodicida]|uniref:Phosphatase PAP2 family protein n=1 Tax=Pseudonocardia nematodicida TaxID=1206997 RepID=A0ABV1K7W0_9PSEU
MTGSPAVAAPTVRDARWTGLAGALLLLAAAGLIVVAAAGRTQPWDDDVVVGLAADRAGWLTVAAILVTTVGNTLGSTVVGLAGGAVLWWRGHRAAGVCLAVVPLVASVAFTGIKLLVERARPPADLQVLRIANESLPSGHATMVAAAWVALVLIPWPYLASRVRTGLAVVAVAWVVAVGLTRIYLGVHWPSDVLAGWALGAGLACAATALLGLLARAGARRDR